MPWKVGNLFHNMLFKPSTNVAPKHNKNNK